jgi:hypothetical protein
VATFGDAGWPITVDMYVKFGPRHWATQRAILQANVSARRTSDRWYREEAQVGGHRPSSSAAEQRTRNRSMAVSRLSASHERAGQGGWRVRCITLNHAQSHQVVGQK